VQQLGRPLQAARHAAHGSPPPPHAVETQSQFEQVPLLGPLVVPVLQAVLEAHQPQDERAVQVLQVLLVAHGSLVPPQALETQSQSEQEPALGPAPEPVAQVALAAHQPQAERAVQVLHVVLERQASVQGAGCR
jgi:hypothetical protein